MILKEMTLEELNEKYGLDKNVTVEELLARQESGQVLNPIYKKHLRASFIIQQVWGHVQRGNISLGKARELTAAIIEEEKTIKLDEEETKQKQQDDDSGSLLAPSLNKRLSFAEELVQRMDRDMPISAILATTYWMQAEMINLNKKLPDNKNIISRSLPDFEYEIFFKAEAFDFCKIDGWFPIATDRIKNPENIEKYIKSGLLRKIKQ